MRRERSRYSRPDVPQASPRRTAAAVAVLVVLAVLGAVLVWFLWQRANEDSALRDRELVASLDGAGEVAAAEGTVPSGDTLTNVLVFLVDDVDAPRPALAGATLLCLNQTQNTASVVVLPTEMGVGDATLAEAFARDGAAGCVAPVAQACGLGLDHVIVLDQAGWDRLEGLSGAGASELASQASELVGMMRTDMDAAGLLELAETTRAVGLSGVERQDAPVTRDGDRVVVDAAALGLAVGALVPAGS